MYKSDAASGTRRSVAGMWHDRNALRMPAKANSFHRSKRMSIIAEELGFIGGTCRFDHGQSGQFF